MNISQLKLRSENFDDDDDDDNNDDDDDDDDDNNNNNTKEILDDKDLNITEINHLIYAAAMVIKGEIN